MTDYKVSTSSDPLTFIPRRMELGCSLMGLHVGNESNSGCLRILFFLSFRLLIKLMPSLTVVRDSVYDRPQGKHLP